jgi:hypothetical protein
MVVIFSQIKKDINEYIHIEIVIMERLKREGGNNVLDKRAE